MANILLLVDDNSPFPNSLQSELLQNNYGVLIYNTTNQADFNFSLLSEIDICIVSLPANSVSLIATGWMLAKYKPVVAYAPTLYTERKFYNTFDGIANTQIELVSLIKRKLCSIQAVDLGLSVLWADRNLGAQSIDDFGLYVRWSNKKSNILKDRSGRVVQIPDGWRLPTVTEIAEMLKKCEIEQGRHLEGKANVIGPSGESVKFKYGSYYSDYWNVSPEPINDAGFYLSSTCNGFNGNPNFLILGYCSGRYRYFIQGNGDNRNFVNARLVKDIE